MADSGQRPIVELYRHQTGARQQIHVTPDQTKTLRVMRGRPVTIVEVSAGAAFRDGSSVMGPGDRDGERSPFPGLAAALIHARERPAERLLVAAHGADEALSARRARSVLLFLRADRAGWAEDAHANATGADAQQVLAWAAAVRGWACDPGRIDGIVGPNTRKALAEFRSRWSAEAGQPAPTGDVGRRDWEAFYDVMDGVLAQVVGEPREELAARREAMGVVERAAVGCGAAWPPERVRIADHLTAEAERVDILFFAEADVPKLECHQDGAAEWKRCDLYRKQKYCAKHPASPAAGTVRVRITGMLFETDKTFLLPRSLGSIKAFKRLHDKRRPRAVLIVGHTDTMGAKKHNLTLSVNRARAIEAYMRDQVEPWLDWYGSDKGGQRWGVREDKYMLSHLVDASGAPFYAGTIDSSATKEYHDALRAFQRWSNEARGTSLKVDGLAQGKGETRRALITAYMAEDETTLPAGATVLVHGCGELHPAKVTGDEVAEEENRRVEVFFFPGPVAPPPRDPCPDPGCAEYEQWLGQAEETIDLRDDLATLEVAVVDQGGLPVADAEVTIDGLGADRGTSGPDGRLVLEDQLPGTYRVTARKQGYEEVTVDAEAPGAVEVTLVRVAPAVARSIPGAVFAPGTAFPTPGAFEHIHWLQREADLGPERLIRVFAHVAPSGDADRDKALSDRRARVVVALLTRDLDELDAVAAEEEWPVACYQAMLRGLGCDPGPLDGEPGPATAAAVRGFQQDYAAGVFHELAGAPRARPAPPVDGRLTPETRAAIRDAYLAVAGSAGRPLPRAAFVAGGTSGCSGFNAETTGTGSDRVEVAVFTSPRPRRSRAAWAMRRRAPSTRPRRRAAGSTARSSCATTRPPTRRSSTCAGGSSRTGGSRSAPSPPCPRARPSPSPSTATRARCPGPRPRRPLTPSDRPSVRSSARWRAGSRAGSPWLAGRPPRAWTRSTGSSGWSTTRRTPGRHPCSRPCSWSRRATAGRARDGPGCAWTASASRRRGRCRGRRSSTTAG